MSTARTPRGRTSSTIRFSPAPSEKATASATDACASPETCGGIGWRRAVSPTCARERRPSSGLIAATMCSSAVVSATLISRKVSSRSTPSGSTSVWCSRFASSVTNGAAATQNADGLSERSAGRSARIREFSAAGSTGEGACREVCRAWRFERWRATPRPSGWRSWRRRLMGTFHQARADGARRRGARWMTLSSGSARRFRSRGCTETPRETAGPELREARSSGRGR